MDGKKYPLIELGQIVRKNPKVITINMVAFPQALPATLKALSESGMNLNPQQEGTTLYVPVPKVTREHRENLSKNAKAHFIKCRDGIRDVQNKFLKTIKSKGKEWSVTRRYQPGKFQNK
uniref:Ribosome-recycling factor, mitochondrial n=1 Tax=Triatoma infestans TaxID=30076 RepID=A0A161MHB4_TRIIF